MNLWDQLKEHTQARIGLHRAGHSISTPEILEFKLAHALARDAVNDIWDVVRIEKKLKALGEKPLRVETTVTARELYLRFPNFGRILSEKSQIKLEKYKKNHHVDIAVIVSDGLSARAIDHHFIPFWKILKPLLKETLSDLKIALILAPFGRVALSDPIGSELGAKLSIICVGERPGLSTVDSLGIYLTYSPKQGNTDIKRNCISNIHPPEGLSYASAADKLCFLITESLRLKLSGVKLKEESDHILLLAQNENVDGAKASGLNRS
ncbi:MAG: ethanolamine ammonia-lyase subunit EutC [Parachlamydiaceae bacterium]